MSVSGLARLIAVPIIIAASSSDVSSNSSDELPPVRPAHLWSSLPPPVTKNQATSSPSRLEVNLGNYCFMPHEETLPEKEDDSPKNNSPSTGSALAGAIEDIIKGDAMRRLELAKEKYGDELDYSLIKRGGNYEICITPKYHDRRTIREASALEVNIENRDRVIVRGKRKDLELQMRKLSDISGHEESWLFVSDNGEEGVAYEVGHNEVNKFFFTADRVIYKIYETNAEGIEELVEEKEGVAEHLRNISGVDIENDFIFDIAKKYPDAGLTLYHIHTRIQQSADEIVQMAVDYQLLNNLAPLNEEQLSIVRREAASYANKSKEGYYEVDGVSSHSDLAQMVSCSWNLDARFPDRRMNFRLISPAFSCDYNLADNNFERVSKMTGEEMVSYTSSLADTLERQIKGYDLSKKSAEEIAKLLTDDNFTVTVR
jgi:hypothetical protein